jgi:predicted dienelactone hydrolase
LKTLAVIRCNVGWPIIGLIAAVMISPAAVAAGTTGYELKTIDSTLHDAVRNRDIPLKIYFPADQHSVSLLIFSHGFGSDRDGYRYLAEGWAKDGYVVVLPTHQGGDRTALGALGPGSIRSGEAVSGAQLSDNAQDDSFVISSFASLIKQSPELSGVADLSRVGMAGHSMGAGTALVLDGATVPGSSASVTDDRIKAFIAISPQGMYSQADLHRWDHVARPTMTMYGSHDVAAQGQPPIWRRDPFEHMPAGDKYNLVVDGANHFSFADEPASSALASIVARGQTRDINEIHDYVVRATLVFWNAYLKGDATAKSLLQRGKTLVPASDIGTLERK